MTIVDDVEDVKVTSGKKTKTAAAMQPACRGLVTIFRSSFVINYLVEPWEIVTMFIPPFYRLSEIS